MTREKIQKGAEAAMAILWKQEEYNGVTSDYKLYREGEEHSMGGRVEAYERQAIDIAEALYRIYVG